MIHGRKRSQRREMTQEELDKANAKLKKVEKINKGFLEKRKAKEYTEKTLEMTMKMAALSPDFDTIWNYRREIITHLNKEKKPDEQYKFFLTELMGLVKLMKENPKSYTLWGHRQWVILEGLKIEKFMTEEQLKPVGGGILNNEIKLCDKMLTADERNFHCWNYRSWVVNTQLSQYDEIEKAVLMKAKLKSKESAKEGEGETETTEEETKEEAYNAEEMKLRKLNEEFDMTTKMAEKNFSNFSAWHYRSKLMLKIHKDSNSPYKVPLDLIHKELDKIKHALFTEPNDQSPWNYHRWLVSLLIPIYILDQKVDLTKKEVSIHFSDVIFDSSKLITTVDGEEVELVSSTHKPESRKFILKLPDGAGDDPKIVIKPRDDLFAKNSTSKSPYDVLEYPSITCFNELLEVEDDLKLAIAYKQRQDQKLAELKESLEKYEFYAFL
ncbi:unnamed protein product [Moneuplotes crassus]|uniref:Geranylgeranyl transferase type-2 subunit alpha n=1 Tax=Euplotes crassus TaxID=5936 RepID=A0AAD1XDD3_EUPCR|nr:unnamed protein product [Moneuplotes crassus]